MKKNSLLESWIPITSISTLVIYILYFILFRFGLGSFFSYLILFLNVLNLGVIIYTFTALLKLKDIIDNFKRHVLFGILRITINIALMLLIGGYVHQL